MVSNEINIIIDEIKKSGTINSEASIIEEFNNYAKSLGLEVAFTIFKKVGVSMAAVQLENGETQSVPTLSIYIRTKENFDKNEIDNHDNNWSSGYKHTKDLVLKWNHLIDHHNQPNEYKSDRMLIFMYSMEQFVIPKLVNLSKKEISDWIEKEEIKPKPEYIFGSSSPSYNIVFSNKSDYDLFHSSAESKLSEAINRILKKNDNFGLFKEGKVKINYLHKEMEGINLYGLSRED